MENLKSVVSSVLGRNITDEELFDIKENFDEFYHNPERYRNSFAVDTINQYLSRRS